MITKGWLYALRDSRTGTPATDASIVSRPRPLSPNRGILSLVKKTKKMCVSVYHVCVYPCASVNTLVLFIDLFGLVFSARNIIVTKAYQSLLGFTA